MSDDADELPQRERARIRSRDRKVRGPKVVVDNPGLLKLAMHLAEKRRQPPASPGAPKATKARRGRRPAPVA